MVLDAFAVVTNMHPIKPAKRIVELIKNRFMLKIFNTKPAVKGFIRSIDLYERLTAHANA